MTGKPDPLDKVRFELPPDAWEAFNARLAAPVTPSPRLVALLRRKPAWEKQA